MPVIQVACRRAATPSLAAADGCVWIFDFDSTIRIQDTQVKSTDVQGILEAAASKGINVAIASASCAEPFMREYLPDEIDSDLFTEEFLYSPAFQACQWYAPAHLLTIRPQGGPVRRSA